MGEVSRALQSLSRTMRDRGGIVDARLKGADALLGLKKLEYDIGRGEKADLRAERSLAMTEAEADRKTEAWGLGESTRQVAKLRGDEALKEETRLSEMFNPNIKQVVPGDQHGIVNALTRGKDGKNLLDSINEGLPGSEWDEETGGRLNKDGSATTISMRDWEQKYKPAMTLSYLASTDPMRYMEGKSYELDQQLKEMDPKSPDYAKVKEQADALKTTMGDRAQLATLYGGQAAKVRQGMLWAKMNNADPKLIDMLERQATRTEGLFKEYKGTLLTPAAAKKQKLELEKLELGLKKTKAEIKKLGSESAKLEKGADKKGITDYQAGQLTTKIWDIVNKADENRAFSPEGPMSKEERQVMFDDLKKSVFPQTQTAGLRGAPKIMTGAAAVKRSKELIKGIDDGTINDTIIENLLKSGQNEVAMPIIAHLKAKLQKPEKPKEKSDFGLGKKGEPSKTEKELSDMADKIKNSPAAKGLGVLKKYKDNLIQSFREQH